MMKILILEANPRQDLSLDREIRYEFTLGDRAITKRAMYQFFKSDFESGFSSNG